MSKNEREIAASGFPAPTLEEAAHELAIIENLLEEHGCPTTCDLIAAASVSVDVAHKDAHSLTSDAVQAQIDEFGKAVLLPLQNQINEQAAATQNMEDRAKFFARMTSVLLQIARVNAVASLNTIKQAIAAAEPPPTINAGSPEDAIKKLLDIPVGNAYKN